jgi:hypothetical protein
MPMTTGIVFFDGFLGGFEGAGEDKSVVISPGVSCFLGGREKTSVAI